MSSVQILKLESLQVGSFDTQQNLIDFALPDDKHAPGHCQGKQVGAPFSPIPRIGVWPKT